MVRDGRRKHLGGLLERAKLHQVVSPIEKILLARVHLRGALIFFRCADEIAGALGDVAEQVVKLARLLYAQHPSDLVPRVVQFAGLEQGERKVVAVRVVGRVDLPRVFEVENGRIELAFVQVERRQCAVRFEAVWLAAHGFRQASLDSRRF